MKLNKRNRLPVGQPQFYLRLMAYSFIRLSEGAYGGNKLLDSPDLQW
jgi:hypothetical protein